MAEIGPDQPEHELGDEHAGRRAADYLGHAAQPQPHHDVGEERAGERRRERRDGQLLRWSAFRPIQNATTITAGLRSAVRSTAARSTGGAGVIGAS